MKVTKRQSRNNEFQLLQEEVDSHGRYAMFIPYISTVYMKMGIKRKCTRYLLAVSRAKYLGHLTK